MVITIIIFLSMIRWLIISRHVTSTQIIIKFQKLGEQVEASNIEKLGENKKWKAEIGQHVEEIPNIKHAECNQN